MEGMTEETTEESGFSADEHGRMSVQRITVNEWKGRVGGFKRSEVTVSAASFLYVRERSCEIAGPGADSLRDRETSEVVNQLPPVVHGQG